MAAEKALALVTRTTDWSETSKIATFWTREFGKVRALAKGGRRLKSNFETALDLLTVCTIVFLRKSSGSLDLLTEAQVKQRFPQLRKDLAALHAGYYVAELLSDWTEDYDPHPVIFDEALATLESLGNPEVATGPRLARFEMVLLRELGHGPALDVCASCETTLIGEPGASTNGEPGASANGEPGASANGEPGASATGVLAFSPAAGGVLCPACQGRRREHQPLSPEAWRALLELNKVGEIRLPELGPAVRAEVRQLLNHYVTYLMGRRPRLLPFLGS